MKRIIQILRLASFIALAFLILLPMLSFSDEIIIDETEIKAPSGETYSVVKKEVDGIPSLEFIGPDGTVFTKEEFNALMIETTPVLSEQLRNRMLRMDPDEDINVTIYMRSQPHITDLEKVRSEFEPQLEALESEIIQINKNLRAERPSLDEASEKEYQFSGEDTSRDANIEESERLFDSKRKLDRVKKDMKLKMSKAIKRSLKDSRAETRSFIKEFGGTVLHEVEGFNIVEAKIPLGQLEALSKEPEVLAIEEIQMPKPRITEEPTDPHSLAGV